MKLFRATRDWSAVLVLGCAVSCTACPSRVKKEAPLGAVGPHEQKATESSAPLRSCASVGPMACAVAPGTRAEVCSQSGPCILQRVPHPGHFDGMSFDCDTGSLPKPLDTAFTLRTEAPPRSGIKATAVVSLVAVNDFVITFGASYLVAEFGEGACLVDIVHDWELRPSYVETTSETRWEQTGTGLRLYVTSRRTMHEPLDDLEFAEGVSDIRSDFCHRLAYDVVDGHFAKVSQESNPGTCQDAGTE